MKLWRCFKQGGNFIPIHIQGNVVAALDAALVGMQSGGRRRVNVRPERGWKLPNASCQKVYTDMAVVPGTQVVFLMFQ